MSATTGLRAMRAGMHVRRLLLARRLASELSQGKARAYGILAVGLAVALSVFGAGYAGAHFVVVHGAAELVRTGMSAGLLGLSAALILSSLGHAAQAFFSAKDLWFWDSTPVPPWARFVDRATETAVAAAPTTMALGAFALGGIVVGGELGLLALVRVLVAIVLIASIPISIGVLLAHVGGALLPAGRLRRVSILVLGVGVGAGLVWFRRARVEKALSPEGAAQILESARSVKQVGPALLPSSLGASFVVDGDAFAFLGLVGWAAAIMLLAYAAHLFLSRRARDLAVDESPVGILRGSWRDAALKLAVRPVPAELRPLVEKDLLAFLRDPAQWGQVILLLGVGALYLVNADALRQGFAQMPEFAAAVLPAMHAGLVTFIAGGLAVRFAFPQVGLEGPAVWIVDGSPLRPRSLMTAKWIAALPVVAIYPTLAAVAGGIVLQLSPILLVVTTVLCACVSTGVCAFGVGRGALKPMFDAASLSELAIGPGAISTMMLSVLLAFFGSVGALFAGIIVLVGETSNIPEPLPLIGAALSAAVPSAIALVAGKRALDRGAVAFVKRREDEATREFMSDVRAPIVIDE